MAEAKVRELMDFGSEKITLLLVDDREDSLMALKACLSSSEYELVTATSGPEALSLMHEHDFALVLLDVQMPGMDGFEVAQALKQFERFRSVPIIFVTAINKELRYVYKGYDVGAVDYVFKPFDPVVLKSKVAVFAELHRKRKLVEKQWTYLRQSEEWYRKLVDEASDVILTLSLDGVIESANPAFETIFNERRESWIGRSIQTLLHVEDRMVFRDAIRSTIENRHTLVELRTASEKVSLDIEVSLRPLLLQQQGVSVLAMIRDISTRKAAERDRRKQFELERINQELEHFAHACSHDLQEPLRVISTFTQLLVQRYAPSLDAEGKSISQFILDGTARMSQLIQDLLAYSRIGGRVEHKAVHLDEALNEALNNLALTIHERRAIVQSDKLPSVVGNASQLMLLFQNLISNALKFCTDRTPQIEVRVLPEAESWLIHIKDNGIGFEMEFAERIFSIFKRLHDSKSYPGTGVGLAICKRIVERHGGEIWATAVPAEGATFSFRLPMA